MALNYFSEHRVKLMYTFCQLIKLPGLDSRDGVAFICRLHRKVEVNVAGNCTAALNYMSEPSQIVSSLPRLDSLGLTV